MEQPAFEWPMCAVWFKEDEPMPWPDDPPEVWQRLYERQWRLYGFNTPDEVRAWWNTTPRPPLKTRATTA